MRKIFASIAPLINLIRLAYLRWALREMGGAHPDAPGVILRIHKLENLQ